MIIVASPLTRSRVGLVNIDGVGMMKMDNDATTRSPQNHEIEHDKIGNVLKTMRSSKTR
jgi:hypothetical protein